MSFLKKKTLAFSLAFSREELKYLPLNLLWKLGSAGGKTNNGLHSHSTICFTWQPPDYVHFDWLYTTCKCFVHVSVAQKQFLFVYFSDVLPRNHQFLSIMYPVGTAVVIGELAADLGFNCIQFFLFCALYWQGIRHDNYIQCYCVSMFFILLNYIHCSKAHRSSFQEILKYL